MAEPTLCLATSDEIADTLAFALKYDGRRRMHDADIAMSRIVAERLVQHLARSGFVVMKRPAAVAPSTSAHPKRHLTE